MAVEAQSVSTDEVTEAYKAFMLSLRRALRNEQEEEFRNNTLLAFGKCFRTIGYDVVSSPEMVNRVKRLGEDLQKMDYLQCLKELDSFLDDLKRKMDVVVLSTRHGTVEWIKAKNEGDKNGQKMDDRKRRALMRSLLIAQEMLDKEMYKSISLDDSSHKRIDKLERLIERLRNRLAKSDGLSLSTGRYSMEAAPEFSSSGIEQIDSKVKELLAKCFPAGMTMGSMSRRALRCPSHMEMRAVVQQANEEFSLGLPRQKVDEIAAKLSTDIGLSIKKKQIYDIKLYMQDLEQYTDMVNREETESDTESSSTETEEDEEGDQPTDEVEAQSEEKLSNEGARHPIANSEHRTETKKNLRRITLISEQSGSDIGSAKTQEEQDADTERPSEPDLGGGEGEGKKRCAVDEEVPMDVDVRTERGRQALPSSKKSKRERESVSNVQQQQPRGSVGTTTPCSSHKRETTKTASLETDIETDKDSSGRTVNPTSEIRKKLRSRPALPSEQQEKEVESSPRADELEELVKSDRMKGDENSDIGTERKRISKHRERDAQVLRSSRRDAVPSREAKSRAAFPPFSSSEERGNNAMGIEEGRPAEPQRKSERTKKQKRREHEDVRFATNQKREDKKAPSAETERRHSHRLDQLSKKSGNVAAVRGEKEPPLKNQAMKEDYGAAQGKRKKHGKIAEEEETIGHPSHREDVSTANHQNEERSDPSRLSSSRGVLSGNDRMSRGSTAGSSTTCLDEGSLGESASYRSARSGKVRQSTARGEMGIAMNEGGAPLTGKSRTASRQAGHIAVKERGEKGTEPDKRPSRSSGPSVVHQSKRRSSGESGSSTDDSSEDSIEVIDLTL